MWYDYLSVSNSDSISSILNQFDAVVIPSLVLRANGSSTSLTIQKKTFTNIPNALTNFISALPTSISCAGPLDDGSTPVNKDNVALMAPFDSLNGTFGSPKTIKIPKGSFTATIIAGGSYTFTYAEANLISNNPIPIIIYQDPTHLGYGTIQRITSNSVKVIMTLGATTNSSPSYWYVDIRNTRDIGYNLVDNSSLWSYSVGTPLLISDDIIIDSGLKIKDFIKMGSLITCLNRQNSSSYNLADGTTLMNLLDDMPLSAESCGVIFRVSNVNNVLGNPNSMESVLNVSFIPYYNPTATKKKYVETVLTSEIYAVNGFNQGASFDKRIMRGFNIIDASSTNLTSTNGRGIIYIAWYDNVIRNIY